MRVLRNLASVEMLPIILAHIDSKDRKTSVGAIKALRALPDEVFDDATVKQKLQKVYFQMSRRYDSSSRTLALDTLLEHKPDSDFLLGLLTSLNQCEAQETEIATYTLQRLEQFAGDEPAIRAKLKQILAHNQYVNNYNVFAKNGLSTAFSRIMYRDVSSNGSFRYGNGRLVL